MKASGVLEVATPPPAMAVPGRIPCTLNVVNPGVRPNSGFTSLFTLAKLVWLAMLNPSAVNCTFAFSPTLCCQVKRASKLTKFGPRPVSRAAPIGRSFVV